MSFAELLISFIVAAGALFAGLAWVGNVMIKKIEAKNNLELKSLDKDGQKVVNLKETLRKQNETIKDQNGTILVLRHQISAMQLKINIIVPMLRRVLKDDPDSGEILDHLENFDVGFNKDSAS